MKKYNPILAVASAVFVLVSLVGCTATTESDKGKAKSTSAAGQGIVESTEMDSCDTNPGQAKAKGNVTMPKGSSGDVVVTVTWVNSEDSSVYARGMATIKDLDSGQSAKWTVAGTVPEDAESVNCVLGVVIPEK